MRMLNVVNSSLCVSIAGACLVSVNAPCETTRASSHAAVQTVSTRTTISTTETVSPSKELFSNLMVGPLIGVNLGNFAMEDEAGNVEHDYSTRTGFALGVFVDGQLSSWFSLEPSLLYLQKGTYYDSPWASGTVRYDFLEIPILAKAKFGTEAVGFFVMAGPYFGFAINREDVPDYNDYTTPLSDDLKAFDFGAQVGLGADIHVTTDISWIISGRYGFSFFNQVDDGVTNGKNGGVLILTGLGFGL